MRSVGVRELRQRASELLDSIEATGNTIEITNHGHPVARLVPITRSAGGSYTDLLTQGWIRPGRGDLLEVEPAAAEGERRNTDELLSDDRDVSGAVRPQ